MEKPKFPKRLPNFCEVLFNDTTDDNKIIFYSDDEPISYAKFKQLVKNFKPNKIFDKLKIIAKENVIDIFKNLTLSNLTKVIFAGILSIFVQVGIYYYNTKYCTYKYPSHSKIKTRNKYR